MISRIYIDTGEVGGFVRHQFGGLAADSLPWRSAYITRLV